MTALIPLPLCVILAGRNLLLAKAVDAFRLEGTEVGVVQIDFQFPINDDYCDRRSFILT